MHPAPISLDFWSSTPARCFLACAVWPHRQARPEPALALGGRPAAVHGDAQQHAALGCHCVAIFLPVRMFAADAAVVVDKWLHRLGQAHHLDIPFKGVPLAEELLAENTEAGARGAANVTGLHRSLTRADHHATLGVDCREARGELRLAVAAIGRKDTPRVRAEELERGLMSHRPTLKRGPKGRTRRGRARR